MSCKVLQEYSHGFYYWSSIKRQSVFFLVYKKVNCTVCIFRVHGKKQYDIMETSITVTRLYLHLFLAVRALLRYIIIKYCKQLIFFNPRNQNLTKHTFYFLLSVQKKVKHGFSCKNISYLFIAYLGELFLVADERNPGSRRVLPEKPSGARRIEPEKW